MDDWSPNEVSGPSSHYRICRVMVSMRTPSPPIVARPEVVYQPLALKHLAANMLITKRVEIAISLPFDIEQVLELARRRVRNSSESLRWDMKDRACPDIEYLRIGNFSQYPGFLNRHLPAAFSCPLVSQARAVLAFLNKANAQQQLDSLGNLNYVAAIRYPLFLQCQSTFPNTVLVPPLDVQVVWFTHMMQSDVYGAYIRNTWPLLQGWPHVVVRGLTPEATAQGEKQLQESRMWTEAKEPWEMLQSCPLTTALPAVAPTVVRGDRQWYREYVSATSTNPDATSNEFFTRAALGYQRYMFLIAKWPNRIEAFGFAPSPPIDLMWHTHLLQPAAWQNDWMRLLGQVHHHKLLPPNERKIQRYRAQRDFEVALWKEEFNEPFILYSSPLTMQPTAYEEHQHYPKPPAPRMVALPVINDDDF